MKYTSVLVEIILGAVILVLCAASAVTATPMQWPTSSGGNNHWYEAFSVPNGITWADARARAQEMNGYLATITSDAENQFVFQLINNQDTFWVQDICGGSNNGPWIGGSDIATEGQWEWITGEAFTYENWKPGQPDNAGGGENCLHFWTYFSNPPESVLCILNHEISIGIRDEKGTNEVIAAC